MTPTPDDAQPEVKAVLRVPPPRRVPFLEVGQLQIVYNPQIERFAKPAAAEKPVPLDPKLVSPSASPQIHETDAAGSAAWIAAARLRA